MVNEDLDPPNYPKAMIRGDVVADVFSAVKQRLKAVFPEDIFKHVILPPSPKEKTWKEIFAPSAVVALGLSEWRANRSSGKIFRGDLSLTVVILLRSAKPADLYLGTGKLRAPGVAGIMAIFAGAIQGWTISTIGTCEIKRMSIPETAEWFDDRAVIIAAEVVVANVALDNSDALEELNNFAGLHSQTRTEKEECR